MPWRKRKKGDREKNLQEQIETREKIKAAKKQMQTDKDNEVIKQLKLAAPAVGRGQIAERKREQEAAAGGASSAPVVVSEQPKREAPIWPKKKNKKRKRRGVQDRVTHFCVAWRLSVC